MANHSGDHGDDFDDDFERAEECVDDAVDLDLVKARVEAHRAVAAAHKVEVHPLQISSPPPRTDVTLAIVVLLDPPESPTPSRFSTLPFKRCQRT